MASTSAGKVAVSVSIDARIRVRSPIRRSIHMIGWVSTRGQDEIRVRVKHRLGGGGGGSVPVATADSVNSTCIELSFLMPQHNIHIPPRAVLFKRYKPTTK